MSQHYAPITPEDPQEFVIQIMDIAFGHKYSDNPAEYREATQRLCDRGYLREKNGTWEALVDDDDRDFEEIADDMFKVVKSTRRLVRVG